MWSRNLGNLFVAATSALGTYPILVLHQYDSNFNRYGSRQRFLPFPFFGVSVFDMGMPLALFFFNLVLTGWAISQFVTAILIRYGLGAESLSGFFAF